MLTALIASSAELATRNTTPAAAPRNPRKCVSALTGSLNHCTFDTPATSPPGVTTASWVANGFDLRDDGLVRRLELADAPALPPEPLGEVEAELVVAAALHPHGVHPARELLL